MIGTSAEKASGAAPGEWAIAGRAVVTAEGLRPAAVIVRGETIAAVIPPEQIPPGLPVQDVGARVLLPGLVDTHVHINEPGRTDWEGFETATRAAAAGGITTLVDMPLNSSPVTTTPEALRQKLAAAEGKLWVDCGFYGGVIPASAGRLDPLIRAGVLGLKAFLCHSGIDEFPNATEADLRRAMPVIARSGLPLLVHAELPEMRDEGRGARGEEENRSSPLSPRPSSLAPRPSSESLVPHQSYRAYLASRPRAWEHDAIRLLIDLCREYRCRVHIVHLASADALPLIAQARNDGLSLTVETCPHYLVFAAEEIPDGDPRFKCAPPIRERENRERLWDGLRAVLIDTIGSDHSPAPPALKELATGDLRRAWGGIASLQLALPAVWTEARRRGWSLAEVVQRMSRRPAELVGLHGRKGVLAAGADADLVVFDPEATFVVDAEQLYHRHKVTPYEGRTLTGRVYQTYLRGRLVYQREDGRGARDEGQGISEAERFAGSPSGKSLLAPAAGGGDHG